MLVKGGLTAGEGVGVLGYQVCGIEGCRRAGGVEFILFVQGGFVRCI